MITFDTPIPDELTHYLDLREHMAVRVEQARLMGHRMQPAEHVGFGDALESRCASCLFRVQVASAEGWSAHGLTLHGRCPAARVAT